MSIDLHHGDCLDIMPTLEAESVDSIVTDPPYGLSFMGKDWDHGVPGEAFWVEALRVAKPGAYLLAFGGTRMVHRLAVAIEDAGWEIRDRIHWCYGSGFPKSHNVSKAIDKAAGAEREVVGVKPVTSNFDDHKGSMMSVSNSGGKNRSHEVNITAPATEAAKQWDGWGTALKPAVEPIIMARKPFVGTVAANVLEHGTGAINVDGCRISGEPWKAHRATGLARDKFFTSGPAAEIDKEPHAQGRWPANLIHDGSYEVVGLFPNDAARFFYCAKASKQDRDEGCEGLEAKNNMRVNGPRESEEAKHATKRNNHHPTVKPTDLMRYLCRLVTPPGGTVLDPFTGSGSTGKAAIREGFNFIGIEKDADYFAIASKRINQHSGLFNPSNLSP